MNEQEQHTFLALRLAQFIGLMPQPGANAPKDRREICMTLMMDIFIGLGIVTEDFDIINRSKYDHFANEFTQGIQNVLREFGIPEDDIPQWNGSTGIDDNMLGL